MALAGVAYVVMVAIICEVGRTPLVAAQNGGKIVARHWVDRREAEISTGRIVG